MEYLRYIQILRRYAVIIILVTIIGTGATTFLTLRQPKVYSATATLLINPAAPSQAIPYLQSAISNVGQYATEQLASTYDVYLKTAKFDATVVQALNLPESAGALASQISSGLVGTTNFYLISATSNYPEEAERIANGVADLFIEQNRQLQQQEQQGTGQSPDAAPPVHAVLREINALLAEDQKLNAQPNQTPAIQARLALIEQRLASLSATYTQLLQQANASQAQTLNTATLASPAQVPEAPIAPKVKQNVLVGAAVSLVLGLLLAFVLDYVDSSVRTPEDAEHATGQLPLAVIGVFGDRQRSRRSTGHHSAHSPEAPAALYTVRNPRDPISEALRTLRTNLAFSTLGQPARSLVVTSLQPSEGKSTVAANLAVVLAQSGKRVILVDTDLRRPTQHQVFGVDKRNGFTELLLGQTTLSEALQDTIVPGLRLLPCGALPSNPSELLSYDAVTPLIARLQAEADMVIFDTPPMGALTDAVVLSTRVEGTIMVVRSGTTRPQVLAKGFETLRKVGARPLGVVLNMVNMSALGSYSYYYYYAYGQYGATEQAAKS